MTDEMVEKIMQGELAPNYLPPNEINEKVLSSLSSPRTMYSYRKFVAAATSICILSLASISGIYASSTGILQRMKQGNQSTYAFTNLDGEVTTKTYQTENGTYVTEYESNGNIYKYGSDDEQDGMIFVELITDQGRKQKGFHFDFADWMDDVDCQWTVRYDVGSVYRDPLTEEEIDGLRKVADAIDDSVISAGILEGIDDSLSGRHVYWIPIHKNPPKDLTLLDMAWFLFEPGEYPIKDQIRKHSSAGADLVVEFTKNADGTISLDTIEE